MPVSSLIQAYIDSMHAGTNTDLDIGKAEVSPTEEPKPDLDIGPAEVTPNIGLDIGPAQVTPAMDSGERLRKLYNQPSGPPQIHPADPNAIAAQILMAPVAQYLQTAHPAAVPEHLAAPMRLPATPYSRVGPADDAGKRKYIDANVLNSRDEIGTEAPLPPRSTTRLTRADIKGNEIFETSMPGTTRPLPDGPAAPLIINPEDVIDERGGNDLPEGLSYPSLHPGDRTPQGSHVAPKGNATHDRPLEVDYKQFTPFDTAIKARDEERRRLKRAAGEDPEDY